MAFSLRLDPETEARIRRHANATGRSKSAVVREAMELYLAGHIEEAKFTRTALDRLKPYVGIVSTDGQFSTDTHAKVRAILERKHRARRSP
jgi:predicted DNA-binding protein